MNETTGRIAVSKAGRDKGRRFAVISAADDGTVMVADGDTRKVDRPKKKKLMHLQFERARIDVESVLASPGGTADAALRKALAKAAHEDDN